MQLNVCLTKNLIYMIILRLYGHTAFVQVTNLILKTLQKPTCAASFVEFHLIHFVLLQMVHIFASETNHFPPIKALFELVTSVTLNIFQQGRHAGNNQPQRVKEIMWF